MYVAGRGARPSLGRAPVAARLLALYWDAPSCALPCTRSAEPRGSYILYISGRRPRAPEQALFVMPSRPRPPRRTQRARACRRGAPPPRALRGPRGRRGQRRPAAAGRTRHCSARGGAAGNGYSCRPRPPRIPHATRPCSEPCAHAELTRRRRHAQRVRGAALGARAVRRPGGGCGLHALFAAARRLLSPADGRALWRPHHPHTRPGASAALARRAKPAGALARPQFRCALFHTPSKGHARGGPGAARRQAPGREGTHPAAARRLQKTSRCSRLAAPVRAPLLGMREGPSVGPPKMFHVS